MRFESTALVMLVLAAGCASNSSPSPAPMPAPPTEPRPDPTAERARQNDEYWAYLAATYDQDRDGRVARAEYTRGDESFQRLDRDRDDELTRADLERDLVLDANLVGPMWLIRMTGRDAQSAELGTAAAAFMKLDANGDGRVDRAEFEAAAPPFMPGVDRFGTLLAGMDADRDGRLARPEVERWLERRDVDGDGVLVLRERDVAGPPLSLGFIEPESREPAPDFVATALADGKQVSLSTMLRRGKKPLAVIFGSFT